MSACSLALFIEVLASISFLRDHRDTDADRTIIFTILGLTLLGFAFCMSRNQVVLEENRLTYQRRWFANWLLRMQPGERNIGRSQMIGFRVDTNPWGEKRLGVFQTGSRPFNIVSGAAKDEFDTFLQVFRKFARADSSRVIPEFEDIWRSPIRRALVGVTAILGLLVAVLSFVVAKVSKGQLEIALVGALVAYTGIRFLTKRS